MTLIQYRDINFRGAARATIEQVNLILATAAADGWDSMTLRQIYYQFVRRNWIPNSEREYKRLGRIITDARYAGQVSWAAIEDAGRNSWHAIGQQTEDGAAGTAWANLKLNTWVDQDTYVEVWVEKQALESTIARPCDALRAPYMACKGYLSASEMWRAGRRFEEAIAKGKRPVLLHLGDHDPSGIDMTRDSDVRLAEIARMGVTVRRLALNMDQVEEYDAPPNPAKQTDSRFTGYEAVHGDESWELDALPQRAIGQIITDALKEYIDWDKWNATLKREQELREPLRRMQERWNEVRELVFDPGRPLNRLRAFEELGFLPDLAETIGRAERVVVAHDQDNNIRLLHGLLGVREGLLEVQAEIDTDRFNPVEYEERPQVEIEEVEDGGEDD